MREIISEKNLTSSIGNILQSGHAAARARIKCSFPVMIKGINALGEHYNQLAIVLDVGRRGLCFKVGQTLIPGSIFTLYRTDDEVDPVATFEVVWEKSCNDRIRKIGAQLVGDNHSWLHYLSFDLVILPGATVTRIGN